MKLKLWLVALALGAGAAHAQDPAAPAVNVGPALGGAAESTADAKTVLDGITQADLEAAVKVHGYTYQWIDEANGRFIEATTKDGLRFSMRLNDCGEGAEARCWTLNLSSYLFNENVRVTLKSINEYNQRTWAGRATLYQDGTSDVVMHLGLNGGVTQAWLTSRFGNYDYIIKTFSDFISGVEPPK